MPPSSEPSAIILAAGYSRRMGRFKPLLRLGGQTVLERVVCLYRQAGLRDIRVVTGFRSLAIRSALAGQPVTLVHNPDHNKGMFSSVRTGVSSLGAEVGSFFVHPVDIPLVRPHTLAMLVEAFDKKSSAVVYALFDDMRGHPPLVHAELKAAILSHDGSGGLGGLLERFDSTARDIQVADEGVLLDLDTPDAYRRLATRLANAATLTRDECRVMMEKVQRLPGPLIDHCRRVAQVAATLTSAVNERGGALDLRLVRSAALVHDVAKLEINHAAAGAHLLREMGFPAMAAIVATHMDIDLPENSPLDERQIVYLADKLVDGNTLMRLSKRFNMKQKKYGHDPQVSVKLDHRRRAAVAIQNKVARALGGPIHPILNEAGIISRRQA